MRHHLPHHSLLCLFFLLSALHLALLVGSSSSLVPTSQQRCLDDQKSILLLLHQDILNHSSTSTYPYFPDPSKSKVQSWDLRETDCCSWEGVTCGIAGRVVELDLSYSMISGGINSIFRLRHLQRLNLALNNFHGTPIPSGFQSLGKLTHLNLSWSFFSHQIPLELSHLTRLVSLDLSCDIDMISLTEYRLKLERPNLETFIQNFTSLKELYLDDVDLSAHGSNWGEALAHALPNLRVLSLLNCSLSGAIHPSLSRLHFLTQLQLDDNLFSGTTVPSFLANFSYLRSLSISSCGLQGKFPMDVFQLPFLQSIDLSYNALLTIQFSRIPENSSLQLLSFIGTNIVESIPTSLGNLTQLVKLDLSWNELSGSIPASFGNLIHLVELNLSKNELSGSIPASFGNLTHLVELDLSENELSGSIPTSLGNLTHLVKLDLSWNKLSGSIPSSFGNLTHLVKLDLSENEFSGSIPASFRNLTRLVELSLSSNKFSESIASSLISLTHLEVLDLSNDCFNGSIPSYMFTLPSLQFLYLSENQFSGQLDEFSNSSNSVLSSIELENNYLTGQIPLSFSTLSRVEELYLGGNNFSETTNLGMVLQNLKSLKKLDLSDFNLFAEGDINNFTIPQLKDLGLRSCNLAKFPKFLQSQASLGYLDLSHNKDLEYVPSWIWNNSSLTDLELSYTAVSFLEPSLGVQNNETPILNTRGNPSFLKLQSLYLISCKISQFPNFLKHQDRLQYLDLSSNKLHGEIPNWIWKEGLQNVNLSHNDLNSFGQLSSAEAPLTSLRTLDIRANNMQGSLPTIMFCNFTSIEILDLSQNHFSGLIPECLGMIDTLIVLNLKGNNFNGAMPRDFSLAKNLWLLNMKSNQLHGKLSTSLVNCTNLEVLDLENNKILDMFPYWLGKLPSLKVLVLRNNRFNGPIESSLENCSFPALHILDLSYNDFVGTLSMKFFHCLKGMTLSIVNEDESDRYIGIGVNYQVSVTLTNKGLEMVMVKILISFASLDLSNNMFHGDIPKEIGNLKSLKTLNLSRNEFTGHIPSSIGNLDQLETLDLSHNALSGRIPSQLTRLTFLEVFCISYNQLEGRIPQVNQFGTFLVGSYEGNAKLCGLPLSRKCWEATLIPPSQGSERSEGSGHFQWKYVWMGYGSGLVMGVSIGYILLLNIEDEQFMNLIDVIRCQGKHGRKSRHK